MLPQILAAFCRVPFEAHSQTYIRCTYESSMHVPGAPGVLALRGVAESEFAVGAPTIMSLALGRLT
jgi:hypothetical protein